MTKTLSQPSVCRTLKMASRSFKSVMNSPNSPAVRTGCLSTSRMMSPLFKPASDAGVPDLNVRHDHAVLCRQAGNADSPNVDRGPWATGGKPPRCTVTV